VPCEGGIVAVLRPGQPVHPRLRQVTCDTPKIHCDDLIDHLRLTVCLRVEGRAHAERDAGHLEEVTPHMTGENRVPVADDGRREPMQTNNAVEECTCNRGDRVGMAEGDEVRVLGESINHHENDRFATDLGQALDRIHRDVRPNLGQNIEGLQ